MLDKLTKQITERRNIKRNYNDYLIELANRFENNKIDKIKDEINENEFQKVFKALNKKKKKQYIIKK